MTSFLIVISIQWYLNKYQIAPNVLLFELPNNLIVVIKNCIVQVRLGNIPTELISIELELKRIPAEN